MSEYTDAKGVVYAVQVGYTAGDIIILSDDLAAWRVSTGVLCTASSVFSDMFASNNSGPKEIILPDARRDDLDIFIRTLCETTPPADISFGRLSKAIDLLRRYECPVAARHLLYHNSKVVEAEQLFDYFVLASQLDCLRSACRVLS